MAERKDPERELALDDFAAVMGNAAGRRFVHRLLGFGRVFADPMAVDPVAQRRYEGRPDLISAHNEALGRLGKFLMDEIAAVDSTGNLYAQMVSEYNNRRLMQAEREKGNDHAHRDRDPRRVLDEDRDSEE